MSAERALSIIDVVSSPSARAFTTEIALAAVHGIEWLDDPLTQLLVGYWGADGEEGIAAFDLDVPPHAGRDGYDMRLRFATILADASPLE